ncbi:MAG: transcription-repair coupling factor, partial [Pseudomonadota bacterium]
MKLLNPPIPGTPGRLADWGFLPGSSLALAVAHQVADRGQFVLVITEDSRSAQILTDEIQAFGQPVLPFPDWETLPYDQFAPHPDITSDRISTLYQLKTTQRGALVMPAQVLAQRIAPPSFIHGQGLVLKIGDRFDPEQERARLGAAGYRCVPQVNERGEFAVRGSLLDLFPMGAEHPLRIELFDDEVETIRSFDPETQLSLEKMDHIALLPAREYPFDKAGADTFRAAFRNRFDVNLQHCEIYKDAKAGVPGNGIEYYLPLFFEQTATIFDYLPERTLLLQVDRLSDALSEAWLQLNARYEDRRHDVRRPILNPTELLLTPEETQAVLDRFVSASYSANPEVKPLLNVSPAPITDLEADGGEERLDEQLKVANGALIAVASSEGRRQILTEHLLGHGQHPGALTQLTDWPSVETGLHTAVGLLNTGFVMEDGPTFLTETELLGRRNTVLRRERRTGRSAETIISDLNDLSPGSPVVHEDYGVGRYQGLNRMSAGGVEAEFLALEYAGGDKIYVPVSALHLISRYTGADPEHAPLHKLNGDQWAKAKRKAAQKVRDVAAELLELYARREARRGRAMPIDHAMYARFCAGFAFQETNDQATAIEAVLADLASDQPMDRVVCGDVGFGKTEVALRAAFVAVQAGSQVVVLVPTTLLAEQHRRSFAERFASWPVRVEALSRFQSKGESTGVLRDLADGKVDIVIGTHRLLQKDVKVKNLGLLIVDEEQRFGVRQKERIKQMRAEVDLLTLTATPIPRTLNMALSGMRDLSIIATAPAHRMAVKTFVAQWDNGTIKDAVSRELNRGGQVYFLHNEVKTIERMARELEELFPHARTGVAHGQMAERELEVIMRDFYQQRINLLVCSTIIENGIDVPSANTIIINRADRLGLSQLHQLRGRVGRSHHRAYAYMITPPPKAMTADAIKRLEALESLEELGIGFTLATHDLEIRGAGELLGDDQSGQIAQVGFQLYMELLERAVRAMRAGQLPEEDLPEAHGCEVDLS